VLEGIFFEKEVLLLKARSRDLAFRMLAHFEVVGVLREKFIEKYGMHHKIPKPKWQKSFYDHYARGERDFENQVDYVIHNFLKHKLSKGWKYTSLNSPDLLDVP